MKISLPDGSVINAAENSTVADVAASISEGLLRNAVCGKVNGELVDLSHVLEKDCEVRILTLKDKEGLQTMRNLGRNMAFLIKSIDLGKQQIGMPQNELGARTSFFD